mmetsp:Transcript_55575/g.131961  ORF Transcript_55575/g.131961 Transcript_55575/m.131961 type:complete len:256 (-) Transcript_55575:48-815(-)|eukprot:CAMPEP_0180142148 /NCGR_PEP_ID=MMETSP0986-20121125/15401_1 /TAXON_ID=697907 /ORGANISM="non described non described, Strain CCMP2293" /LENGTH=255 /DNA_ID=CAMNT_0022085277 /DNA_START=13 /DNA_END=780 /DNA_ORIENTATION=+
MARRGLVTALLPLALLLPAAAFQPSAIIRHSAGSAVPISAGRSLPLLSLSRAPRARAALLALRAEGQTAASPSPEMTKMARDLGNASWVAWWAQTILCVVSAVTLFFANAVKGAAQGNLLSNGIFLAGIGLSLGFVNVFWTTGYRGIAAKILKESDPSKTISRLRRTVKVGVVIALVGMFLTLMGAEQIVGMLVAKSISGSLVFAQGGAALSAQSASMQLQALDIFVVQANTNTMLAHLAALSMSLYASTRLPPK